MSGPQGLFRALGRIPDQINAPVPHGFFETPAAATHALVRAEAVRLARLPALWDPGVGGGAIVDVLQRHGFRTRGSDLVMRWLPRERPDWWRQNLFDVTELPLPGTGVVCNPPFDLISPRSGDVPWVRHLLELGAPYVAMLASATWMHAANRAAFLKRHPPARVLPICWRLDWTGKGRPSQNHSWFIWDVGQTGATELRPVYRPPAGDEG